MTQTGESLKVVSLKEKMIVFSPPPSNKIFGNTFIE